MLAHMIGRTFIYRRSVLAAALLMAIAAPSSAAFRVVEAQHGQGAAPELYLTGDISTATVSELRALSAGGRLNGAIVYLDSSGGDPQAGLSLGTLIRERRMNTAVGRAGASAGRPAKGSCLSACVLAYAGGTFRFIDPAAVLGIHRFYRRTASAGDLALAQVMSAAITSYLIRMGIDPALFERMAAVDGDKMMFLPHAEALKLNLVNNGVLPAEWAIEGKHGSVYLAGRQITSNGTGKVTMSCAPGSRIRFSALYDAGTNNRYISTHTSHYSLRVNNQFLPISSMSKPAAVSGDYVTASFLPDLNLLWALSGAQQIGFGFHTEDSDTFFGFLISAAGQQDLIRSWVRHCTESSPGTGA